MKAIQYFSDDYLAQCGATSPEQILRYLDDFRRLHAATLMKAWVVNQEMPQVTRHDD